MKKNPVFEAALTCEFFDSEVKICRYADRGFHTIINTGSPQLPLMLPSPNGQACAAAAPCAKNGRRHGVFIFFLMILHVLLLTNQEDGNII
jgi:hypothetical protein